MQRMWQREGRLKQVSFTLSKWQRDLSFAFVERKDIIINNHLQLHLGKGIL